jgi:mannose-6-phosphate isomerase-like protein (cupin superfamily)
MKLFEKMDWAALKHEYGLDGKRLLPWDGLAAPFGGAWAVVRAGTRSLPHRNDPPEEEELFFCVSGRAKVCVGDELLDVQKGDLVFFPAGIWHYAENPYEEDFHMYCIWWDPSSASRYLSKRG